MDAKQFISSLRTLLPGVEEFLLETLLKEDLSENALTHLNLIQDKLIDLKTISQSLVQTDLNYSQLESNLHENLLYPQSSDDSVVSNILTPPSPFLCGSEDGFPIISSVKSLASEYTNSEDSRFSLRMSDSDPNGHSHSPTHIMENQFRDKANSHSGGSFYPIFNVTRESPHTSVVRGHSDSNEIISGHISINSDSDCSSITSPNLNNSKTNLFKKKIITKRKRDQVSIRGRRKRSKLSELAKKGNCRVASSDEESLTNLNQHQELVATNLNKYQELVATNLNQHQELVDNIPNAPELPLESTTVCEDRTVHTLSSPIYHNIISDESSGNNDAPSMNSESYEISDQSPTNLSSPENSDIPSEFSGYIDKPACVLYPGKELSPVIDITATNENGLASVNDCPIQLDTPDDLENNTDVLPNVLSPHNPTETSAKSSDTSPHLSLDKSVNCSNSKHKITDFFNSKVTTEGTRHRSIFSSSSSSSPQSPESDNSQIRNESISKDTQDDDVIDLHVNPEDAFPSSLSDCETLPCETGTNTCPLTESEDLVSPKSSVRSRLGDRGNYTLDSVILDRRHQLLRTHRKNYNIVHQKQESQFKCGKCRENIPIKPGKLYQCKQCHGKYVKIEEFVNHRSLESEKVFCSHCKIDFKTKCELTLHKQTKKHPNPKLCEDCVQKVENKPPISLACESNSSPAHDIEGSYRCQKCSRRFKLISQLETHTRHHHVNVNASHFISEDPNSLPLARPEVWPPPKINRSSSNQLEADSEITQNINYADQAFNIIKNRF